MASEDKDYLAWKTLFQEQIDFFRQKLNLPTARWDDIWQAAHDRAFIVAGAQAADLLADLRSAVDRAIAGGGSIGAFRKDFEAIIQKHGWRGFTGDGSKAGMAWRTRVIYQTNMATSYAAGRWQQLNDPELVKLRPYWQYIHADGVLHPRPLHLSWHGLTLPRTHPFWQTHFPPNGWGCHCRVRAVGQREYDAAVANGRGPEAAPADEDTAGIDPGWAYAPGKTWMPEVGKYPLSVAREMIAANMADGVFERWHSRIAEAVASELLKPEFTGLSKEAVNALLRQRLARGENFPVAVMDKERQALLGVQSSVVVLSDYDAIKQALSRAGDPNFTFEAYQSVQGIMDDAELIVRENDQMTVWFKRNARLLVAVIQQTRSGKGVFLKSLRFGTEKEKRRSLGNGTAIFEK